MTRGVSPAITRFHPFTPASLVGCLLLAQVQRARWVMERLVRAFRRSGDPNRQKGTLGYVLAWLLGIPIPILIIVALLRGCS